MKKAITIAAMVWFGQGVAAAEAVRVGLALSPDVQGIASQRQLRDGFELGMRRSSHLLGGRDVVISEVPEGPAATEAQRIEEFVRVNKPEILIVDGAMARNNAQMKVLSDAGVIVIVPDLGPADLAGKRCLPNTFVTGAQSDQALDALAAHADAVYGRRHVLVFAEGLEQRAAKLGRLIKTELLRKVAIPAAAPSYEAQVEKLLVDAPQAITLVAPPETAKPFLTALRAAPGGAEIPVLWSEGSDETALAALGPAALGSAAQGSAGAGLIVAGGWANGIEGPANTEFSAEFEQAFGFVPSSLAVYAYDAARLIDVALAKTPEPVTNAALRDALHSSAIDSPRGVVSFANNNFPIQDFYIKRAEPRPDGSMWTRPVIKIFGQFGDDFAAECPLR